VPGGDADAVALGLRAMRFLFATWDGGGNVPPTLRLARGLVLRGHSVRVLVPASLKDPVGDADCSYAAYDQALEESARSPRRRRGPGRLCEKLTFAPELKFASSASAFATDVLAELERFPADALVADFMLAGAVAAGERAGVPTAVLVHTIYCLPAPGLPPPGLGLMPARGAAGRIRDAALAAVRRRATASLLFALNDTREQLDLRPVASGVEHLSRAERMLVLTSESFDFPATLLPENVRYADPQRDRQAVVRRRAERGELPLVLVAPSTRTADTALVQRVLDVLGDLPVRGLLTSGPALSPTGLRVPSNVAPHRFLPHDEVVPDASLVVTQAGLGTVMVALQVGVPLLCIPFRGDQFDVAARVVAAGAGRRLPRSASRRSLRRVISEMLADGRYREAAERMARSLATSGDGATRALDELEQVAAERA
jgi:MGT family glycosyltransferase